MVARLLAEARVVEGANLKEERKKAKLEGSMEEEQEMDMRGDGRVKKDANVNEESLLVHGLKGRRPKLSEEKKEEILTGNTIRSTNCTNSAIYDIYRNNANW